MSLIRSRVTPGVVSQVVLNVLMVDVDILGLMYFWGLTVDSVTIVNLVLAIGEMQSEYSRDRM